MSWKILLFPPFVVWYVLWAVGFLLGGVVGTAIAGCVWITMMFWMPRTMRKLMVAMDKLVGY